MILEVRFGDNDFSWPIENACKDLLSTLTNGYKPQEKESLEEVHKWVKDVGIEGVRNSVVVGSWGHYIALKARHVLIDVKFGH